MTQVAATVADAMLRHPTVHPAGLSIGEARAAFDASIKTHLLLLVRDGALVSSLTREEAAADVGVATPAATVGSLAGRTVAPGVLLGPTRDLMVREGIRRLAVVDPSMRLLGLLCLKRDLTGFCTDDGVAAMRAARRHEARSA